MRTIKQLLLFTMLITSLSACKKKYDEPPENQLPIGNVITIAELKDMYSGPGSNLEINEDYSIYANVTTEETNGNFYKDAFIQDASGGIKLVFTSACGLYIGDSIRLNINGTVLNDYRNLIQVDQIDPYTNVVKIATDRTVEPEVFTMQQLNTTLHQSKLIKLENVEFRADNLGRTYADGVNLITSNRNLINCNEDSILVRTSGYANFASDTIPSLNGTITGIMSIYNNDIQLFIRDINEVVMNEERCTGGSGGGGTSGAILSKTFDDGSITSGGWGSFWTGTTTTENWGEWEIFGGDVASASNFDINTFTNYACESWLVSPTVDLSGTSAPFLSFDNVVRYTPGPQPNDGLELLISSDYDGTSDPTQQGNWTNITSYVPNWDVDSGDWTFVSSGNIDLTSFIAPTISVAFKYTGTNNDGATWEIDNILINE
mgnify:CR=1 FL=1